MELSEINLRNGTWEGRLTGAPQNGAEPELRVTWQDRPVDGMQLTADEEPGQWIVRVPIPTEAIADGVQTFVITDGAGTRMAVFSLIAGAPAADDIRVEIELLRAELDLLKGAFRRHCAETG
ncbi:hypothetical protein [Marinibacterium sp. SX1]|uniref:hypothetical protein n=1 Tax=Marinibacterium sp. SX1 TaxID=3388424 RepID=UPI003D17D1B8